MAFLGVFGQPEQRESLGSLLGKGIGTAFSTGADRAMQLRGERKKQEAKLLEDQQRKAEKLLADQEKKAAKDITRLHDKAHRYIEKHHGTYSHPARARPLITKAEEYLKDGFEYDEAIDLAVRDLEQERLAPGAQKPQSFAHPSGIRTPNEGSNFKEGVKALLTGGLSAVDWMGKHGTGMIPGVEGIRRRQMEETGIPEISPSEYFEQQLKEGKTPEEQELIEKRIAAGSVLPLGSAISSLGRAAFKPLWKAAKSLAKKEGMAVGKAAERMVEQAAKEGVDVAKAVAGDVEEIAKLNSLAGRVSAEVPKDATKLRMNRLSPESKLYKTGEQQKILEEQLKSHPKYAAEIAADAEARNARLSRPIGERAMATRSVRMAQAESELPKAVDSYRKASSRVRALEDHIAKLPEKEASKLKEVLEAAKNELRDAESYAKNMLSNTRTGESWKVGSGEMRQSAQKKLMDIESKIADGETVKLSKADYNPDTVKEAKKLAKKKEVPASKKDDFYTQVHDEYAREYRKKIEKLNEEIAKPVRSLSEGAEKAKKIKERDILQKMVDHTQAENLIHRRKLGLREMEQRKLARDRLSSTTKKTEAPKVEEAARPRMEMAEKTREAMKTSEGRAKLAEEVVEEAAKDAPKAGPKIKAQKGKLEEALDKVEKAKNKIKSKKQPKTKEEAKSTFKKIADDFMEVRDALKEGGLSVFKTKIGKDLATSIFVEAGAQVSEAFDLPKIPYASLASVAIGTGGRGRAYRVIFNALMHAGINKIKKEHYKGTLERYDSEKARKLKERYPTRVIKQGEKEFRESTLR